MNTTRRAVLVWAGLWLCVSGFSGPALADAAAEFHSRSADAYRHYREAVFYLKRKNAMAGGFELESFRDKWRALDAAYGEKPPAPYAKDAKWAETLAAVAAVAEKALASAMDGETEAATKALAPVQTMLSELRKRNGIVLFRDHIEAANAAFERLFHFRRTPPDFADPAQVKRLREDLTAAIAAYKTCREKAPTAVASDEQFRRLIDDSLFYLDRMWLAIDEKNQVNVVNILRRVVSSDDILWLRYG
jgi:hypothetical protein